MLELKTEKAENMKTAKKQTLTCSTITVQLTRSIKTNL